MLEQFYFVNQEVPNFVRFVVFVFGACWGSFLNVVIYRVPAEKSVVTPGSHCSCGKPIAWYDNIPILSWMILRGKARCCGQGFSIRYPSIEFLTGALFLACWWMNQGNLAVATLGWLFISLLVAGTFIDFDHMILPDFATIGGAVIGVALSFAFPALHGYASDEIWVVNGMRGALTACLGALIGSGVVLWIMVISEVILKKEAMGFGDVVFMGCIGAFCGWKGALFAIFGGAMMGSLFVIPLMLSQKVFGWPNFTPGKVENPEKAEPEGAEKASAEKDGASSEEDEAELGIGSAIPFGPWLALGGLVYYIFLREQVDNYLISVTDLIFSPMWGG